jgi:hypothetical protein
MVRRSSRPRALTADRQQSGETLLNCETSAGLIIFTRFSVDTDYSEPVSAIQRAPLTSIAARPGTSPRKARADARAQRQTVPVQTLPWGPGVGWVAPGGKAHGTAAGPGTDAWVVGTGLHGDASPESARPSPTAPDQKAAPGIARPSGDEGASIVRLQRGHDHPWPRSRFRLKWRWPGRAGRTGPSCNAPARRTGLAGCAGSIYRVGPTASPAEHSCVCPTGRGWRSVAKIDCPQPHGQSGSCPCRRGFAGRLGAKWRRKARRSRHFDRVPQLDRPHSQRAAG